MTTWLRLYEGEKWMGILSGWLDLEGIPHRKRHLLGVGKQGNQLDIHMRCSTQRWVCRSNGGTQKNKGFGIHKTVQMLSLNSRSAECGASL